MIFSAICHNDGCVVRSAIRPLRLDLLEKIATSGLG